MSNDADVAGNRSNFDQADRWRFRRFNDRWWYWLGDRGTGRWAYFDNGRWYDVDRGVWLSPGRTTTGYRGDSFFDGQYYGPYYFDGDGRRFYRDGSGSYYPDQIWQDRFWNDDFGTRYRAERWYDNRGARAGANIGGAIGEAVGGARGGAIGAEIGREIGRD
jgi:hypothetical protein